MKTYRVTVVRMVECEATVEADSPAEAKLLARKGQWDDIDFGHQVGVEVVGEPEEINEGDE